MAGFRLRPVARLARKRPWQRRRLFLSYTPTPAYITGDSVASAAGSLDLLIDTTRKPAQVALDLTGALVVLDVSSASVTLDVSSASVALDVSSASVTLDTV